MRRSSSGLISAISPRSETPGELSPFQAMRPNAAVEAELEALRREVADMRRLQEVIHFLNGAPDLATLQRELLDLAISVSGLPRGMLALRCSADDGVVRYKVREKRGFEGCKTRAHDIKALRGILNGVLETREPLFEGCVRKALVGAAHKAPQRRLGAVVALPLLAGNDFLGVVILDDPARDEDFTAAETSLLRSFARHASQALKRVSEHSRLRRKLARLERRNERLEAEREQLNKDAHRARRASMRLRDERSRTGADARAAGQLRRLLEMDLSSAKRAFLRRYLREMMDASGGDLRAASEASGLSASRLASLFEQLGIDAPTRRSGSGVL